MQPRSGVKYSPELPIHSFMDRILYVDDDVDALSAFRRALSRCGFEIDTARSAAIALRLAAERSYAVVATDLDMPERDGLALIESLYSVAPTTSFLLVTGAANRRELDLPTNSESARSITCVVHKPWDTDTMEQALRRSIALHQSRAVAPQNDAPVATFEVLVVEDNPGDAALIRSLLSRIPTTRYQVTQVPRLGQAIDVLDSNTFSVIVTDLSLPDARGMDAIARLQNMAPSTPIVVMSGAGDEELALQAVELGAQDYIVKGNVDADALNRALRYAIQRKRSEDSLTFLAQHDPLTGLANRSLFRERVTRALNRARRHNTHPAILAVDLDRFKLVNDTLGHEAGDALLTHIAERLGRVVCDVDTVARLGGDEFAVLLDDAVDDNTAGQVAARLLHALEPAAVLGDSSMGVTASVGVALYPRNGDTPEALLKSADAAMYRAKQNGRNNYQFYDRKMHKQASRRLQLERDLRGVLSRAELELYYQPQSSVEGDRTVSVEALLRWNHPKLGMISPAEFIPLLEESGQIIEVGEWVCRQACAQAHRWQQTLGRPVRVAVNVSPRQFDDPGFADRVAEAVRWSKLPAACLELEITERLLLDDPDCAATTLRELKEIGVRIAMDDFGTGYSQLAYLVRFPFDVLKIDRSVIETIGHGDGNSVVTAVIRLAHTLGLGVIAEGVEEMTQLSFLRARGCDMFQGYLRARPLHASECEEWLRRDAIGHVAS